MPRAVAGAMYEQCEPPDDDLCALFEYDEDGAWSPPPSMPPSPVVLPVELGSTAVAQTETPQAAKRACSFSEETPAKVVEVKRRFMGKGPPRSSDGARVPEASENSAASTRVPAWDRVILDMQNGEVNYDAAETVPLLPTTGAEPTDFRSPEEKLADFRVAEKVARRVCYKDNREAFASLSGNAKKTAIRAVWSGKSASERRACAVRAMEELFLKGEETVALARYLRWNKHSQEVAANVDESKAAPFLHAKFGLFT